MSTQNYTAPIRPSCPQSPLGKDFQIATLKHEINRLNRVMRQPSLSADERVIAGAQLRFYSESLSEVN